MRPKSSASLHAAAHAAIIAIALSTATLATTPFTAHAASLPPQRAEFSAIETLTGSATTLRARLHHAKGLERRETDAGGVRSVLLARPDRGKVTVIQPDAKLAMDLPPGDPEAGLDKSWLARLEGEPLGKETVQGLETVKFRVRGGDERGGFDGFVWSTPDGIYARIQGAVTDGGEPVEVRLELSEVKRGRQDPALFELPPGVTALRFDVPPDRMPEALKDDAKRLGR